MNEDINTCGSIERCFWERDSCKEVEFSPLHGSL